jgi:hypothetical protein
MPLHRGRRPWAGTIVVAVTWAALAGCSSNSESASVCAPGRSVACVGVGGCIGGQVCASDGSSFGPCLCQETGSKVIGPAGGVVQTGGASVTVPPGALSTSTGITVTVRTDTPPSPYESCSAFYQFGPAGLTFAIPVEVVLPDHGCASSSAMYWSQLGASGYERLSTDLMAASASAQVTHFSTGFVGRLRPQGMGPPMDGGGDHDSTIADAGTDTDSTVPDSASDTPAPDVGSDTAPPPCTGASSCPAGEACNAGVCSTSCSSSSPCNGGCCDGAMCQPGTSPTACGISGGACTSCSGGTPACGATGTCVFCSTASDCPTGQACTGGSCSTACSASSSCNGGCCDGAECQPGNAPSLCGSSGGLCSSCSGSTPVCDSSGACAECNTAADCPWAEACNLGTHTCSGLCGAGSSACNGVCCYSGCCYGGPASTCGPGTGTVCNGGASGEECNPCQEEYVCTAGGTCGCDWTSSNDCPAGTACNSSTGLCESACTASGAWCSGTCCNVSAGQCAPFPEPATACGLSPESCLDCTTSDCATNGRHGSAGGRACVASVSCGCQSDADCSGCTTLTVCNTATSVCSAPDAGP